MLWEITRPTPAKSAASIRLRVPSRRMRLLAAKSCEDRSVSWWKTTSGRAAATTSRNPAASYTSPTTVRTPSATAWSRRVSAVTSWP